MGDLVWEQLLAEALAEIQRLEGELKFQRGIYEVLSQKFAAEFEKTKELRTALAASESRWSVQREAASQLRLDRAKCVAMLEKAQNFLDDECFETDGSEYIIGAREQVAEIIALLASLRGDIQDG